MPERHRLNLGAAIIATAVGGIVLVGTAFGFGDFQSVRTLPNSGKDYAVVISDLDGDGKADIVAANGENADDHVSVFRGKGNGTFRPEEELTAGGEPDGVAVGDVNGDGRKDIAVANYADDTVSLLLQRKNGKFKDGGTLASGPGCWVIAIADLNRDGKTDLVTGNYSSTGPDAVSVLEGKGNGKFRAHRDYAAGPESYGMAVGKMNGDKRPDVVSIDGDGNPSVLLSKGNGTLKAPIQQSVPGGDSYGLTLGDFNGDGKRDAAVADYTDDAVMVLRGKGDGHLKPPISTGADGLGPNTLAAGDFNRDGKLDLAAGPYDSPYGLAIFRGKGSGKFKAPKSYGGSDTAQSITAGHLNGDKGLDVAVGTDTGVDVFLNKK